MNPSASAPVRPLLESLEPRLLLSTTVLSETFEGAFPSANGWAVADLNADGTPASWGKVNSTFGGEGTHRGSGKGYCAGVGYSGTSDSPRYRDLMSSAMSTTIDLTSVTSASLSFWQKIPLLGGGDHARVYIDSTLVYDRAASQSYWNSQTINLSAYVGGSHVLTFEFDSNESGVAEGWYLDDILVTGEPMPGPDPNDALGQAGAVTVGATVSGTISAAGTSPDPGLDVADVDMYRFSVSAGQRLAFDVDRPSGSLDPYLRLFDAAGTPLAASNDAAGPSPEYSSLESYLDYTFAQAGTYYVGVSGYGNVAYDALTGTGDVAGSAGAYTLTIALGTDPNDQLSEAISVAVGEAASGTIGAAGTSADPGRDSADVDMYRFSVAAGQRVAFDIDSPSGGLDSYIRIFSATGGVLASNNNGPNPTEGSTSESYLEYTFAAAGTYYVGVSGYVNIYYSAIAGSGDISGSTGAYTLTLTAVTPASDPNDQIGEAITVSVGGTVAGTISAAGTTPDPAGDAGDVDMYRITVTAGQRLGLDIDRPSGSLDSYLRLYSASGALVAANDNGAAPSEAAGLDSYLAYTFASAGTYYVGISGFGNIAYNPLTGAGDVGGSTGAYTLSVTAISTGGSGYHIEMTFAGLTPTQQVIFQQAAARWEQVIIGDLPDAVYQGLAIDDLRIDASAVVIDGAGGILGQATATNVRSGTYLPYRGYMQFDTADLAYMEANGMLLSVIEHEMGHVMGFGTIWSALGLLSGTSGSDPIFVGAQATAAYNSLFGTSAAGVPVENGGGSGTRLAHWRESVFSNELMTGWIGGGYNPLSVITVASMADLGYQVNLSAADPYV